MDFKELNIKNLNLNKKLLVCLCIIITLPLLILFIIKMTPSSRDISKLNKINKQLQECNSNLINSIDDQTINLETAESILNSGLLKLNELSIATDSLEVVEKNEDLKKTFKEALDNNISLYELSLSLINNPNDATISENYNKYTNTYNKLLKNYQTLNLLGIKEPFPDTAKTFFNNSSSYLSTTVKSNRENDIKVDQKNSYINTIEICIENLESISEDLEPALDKIRSDGRSLDVLLTDIKEKKSRFNEIKSDSYSIIIPENGNDCYELLKDTLNYYQLYIISLEHSITLESSSTTNNEGEYTNKNYLNSFSKYDDFKTSLNELKSELDNFNKN